ncbi:MAG: asparagine synthase (glutamine-hydrolyzing) [Deltaproteobacteria bacterium]|nr:MAG: asparagine synthase (glutamine-hydrolyzing) [Deltaproteobacteria bacterium]
MCGIGGIVLFDGSSPDSAGMQRMVDALRHRGPDDEAFCVQPGLGLAHTRLSIIDLSPAGRQPMQVESANLSIVYNGEVYNHRELRRTLEAKGHRFRSSCDTEVVLRAYAEWGDTCVNRLEGMFAFALWDADRRRLFAARDRLGIKPFYYHFDSATGEFLFGSEIKALLAYRLRSFDLDLAALDDYLAFGFIPLSRTPFRGVCKLPAAHVLTLERGVLALQRYWDVDFCRTDRPAVTDAGEVAATLEAAVRRHLIADVPVGAFLSGGIDSSAVVAVMRESVDVPLATFSVGFEEPSYDERAFARTVARRLGTDHHEVICTARDFESLWATTVWHADGLAADISNVPLFMLARDARRHVPVVLSGDGGDEMFGGYPTYRADRLAAVYRRVPRPLRSAVATLSTALPASTAKLSFDFRLRQFLAGVELDEVARSHFAWRRIFTGAERALVLDAGPDGRDVSDSEEALARLFHDAPAATVLQRAVYADINSFLVDSILAKVDAMTMAHGLEARVPLLDREVVELAGTVPDRLKMRWGEGKRIFRKAVRARLPREVIARAKSPFQPPLAEWLRRDLRAMVGEVLSDDRVRALGFLRPSGIAALKSEHFAGRANHGFKLWLLLNLVEWHRLFVEGQWTARLAGGRSRPSGPERATRPAPGR